MNPTLLKPVETTMAMNVYCECLNLSLKWWPTPSFYIKHTHTLSTTQEQNPRGALGYPALCTQSVLVAQGETFKLKAKSHLLQNNIQLGQPCEHPTLNAAFEREEVDVTKAVSSCFLQFWLWLIKQPAIKFLWVWMCLVIWNYLHAWLLPQR